MGQLSATAFYPISDGNAVLNGNFRINQFNYENAVNVPAGANYFCDGWIVDTSGGTAQCQNIAFKRLKISPPVIFADADKCALRQKIEGIVFTQFVTPFVSNPPLALTFKAQFQRIGVPPGVAVRLPITINSTGFGGGAQFCSFADMVPDANGTAYGGIGIPIGNPGGPPFNFQYDQNTVALEINFHFVPNTPNVVTANVVNTWVANVTGGVAPNGTNFLNNAGNIAYITDICLTRAVFQGVTPMRSFANEMLFAQRYYEKSFAANVVPAQNVGSSLGAASYFAYAAGAVKSGYRIDYKVPKAKIPTVTTYNPSAANANWRNLTAGADSGVATQDIVDTNGMLIGNAQVAGDAINNAIAVHWTADARL